MLKRLPKNVDLPSGKLLPEQLSVSAEERFRVVKKSKEEADTEGHALFLLSCGC